MKKVLLSILAGALLVVGCQNYDDQFDALETQINALASTVAGLSQVQSDLSSLAGTVASLSSTVNGLGSTIDTAVSDGLSDIQADVDAITAAVADVASAEEVASLSSAVADANTDLDNLLANSSVFNGPVTINSVATLNAFHAMGTGLNIVNGDVIFNVSAGMDATKVQETVDNILTITGDLTYTGAATEAMPTFLNLSGAASMTIEGAGDYRFDNLISAGNIILDNDNTSKITIVHLGSLVTYMSLQDDGGVANTLDFKNATEFHLSSVKVLAGSKLDITIDKGGVLAIGALTGLNSLDKTDVVDLDITGPSSVALTTIADGTINLIDVKTASISDFYGAITIGKGVESLTTVKAVALDISAATDLETAVLDIATDYDPLLSATAAASAALATAYIDVTFASQDLETASVSGKVDVLTADGQNNLTALTVTGHATSIVAQNNNDLITLTLTGATVGNVTADNNDNMESLTLDATAYVTTADPGLTVSVDGNANLTALTIKTDKIDNLSIQSNGDLATITADGLATIGGTTATVAVDNNDLKVSIAADAYNASTAGTVDAGAYTQTSIVGFQTYLDAAVAAPSTDGVKVFFDEIDSYTVQSTQAGTAADTAVPTVAYTAANIYSVAYVTASVSTGRTTYQNVTLALPVNRDANNVDVLLNTTPGDNITVINGTGGTKTFQYTASTITTVDQLVAAMNGDTTVPGVTISADRDAFHEQVISISYTYSDGSVATTSSGDAGTGNLFFTYGTDPQTGSAIAAQANVATGSASGAIAVDIATAFNAATNAYVATATLDGKIAIVALVSGTLSEDRGPQTVGHSFNTLTVFETTTTNSTTVALAGATHAGEVSALSNTTAVASSLYNFSATSALYSGVRVTARNNSTAAALTMSVTVANTNSSAFKGKDGGAGPDGPSFHDLLAQALVSSGDTDNQNMAALGVSSSALDYVSTFANVESPVTTAGGTTDRTGWLSN